MVTPSSFDISEHRPSGAPVGCLDVPKGVRKGIILGCVADGRCVCIKSDGGVPEHSCLCRIRRWTDLFGPAALPARREGRGALLLALTPLVVPFFAAVWGRPLQIFLQSRMLSGADFFAECSLPFNLLQHCGVSTYPWHLGHLRGRDNITESQESLQYLSGTITVRCHV